MNEQKIEFEWLEAKRTGTDTVVFRLEDGATVKVKVDLDRVGVAKNITNPDGTPHYDIGATLKVNVTPPKKSYYRPKSSLRISKNKKGKQQDVPFIR